MAHHLVVLHADQNVSTIPFGATSYQLLPAMLSIIYDVSVNRLTKTKSRIVKASTVRHTNVRTCTMRLRKMTLFWNGLPRSIQTIVTGFRECKESRELSYKEHVQLSLQRWESHQARTGRLCVAESRKCEHQRSNHSLHRIGFGYETISQQWTASVHFRWQLVAILWLSIFHQYVQLPNVSVGWEPGVSKVPIRGQTRSESSTRQRFCEMLPRMDGTRRKIIFYQCFNVRLHIKQDCTAQLTDMDLVLNKYERLSEKQNKLLPSDSLSLAKQYL